MGRTARTAAVESMAPEFIGKTPVALAIKEAALNKQQELVVAEFGDGLPYVREHYEAEIRRDMVRTLEAVIAAGRRLVVMKELEPHGSFIESLKRMGLDHSVATRMMASARRIGSADMANPTQLQRIGNQSKLFELLTLPDNQFSELVSTGETGDLSMDEVESMGVRELRAKLREAREEIETKEQRAAKREKEIERLEAKTRKLTRQLKDATPDEIAEQLRQAANLAVFDVRTRIHATGDNGKGEPVNSLRNHFAALIAHGEETGVDHRDFLGGLIGELLVELRKLRDDDDFVLPIVSDGDAQ